MQTLIAFRRFSKWSAVIGMLVGYHVILGWLFDISVLRTPWPNFSPMKMNSALCSILAGGCLYVLVRDRIRVSRGRRIFVRACAVAIMLLSFVSLIEWLFGVDLRINNWFSFPSENGMPPRMDMMTALGFFMIGLALSLLDGPKTYRIAEPLTLTSAAISMLAITGYVYQAEALQGQMSLYASLVIVLLSGGILCARADRGLMAKITSNSFGGLMARRLLPATLLIPLVLGWLQRVGQRAGLYPAEPGLALLTVANVAVYIFVVWWGVNSLHRMDTKRRQAEQELQETAAKLSRSNADLEQFAYVASHDLKEPLRAISGSVQILQERYRGNLGPEAQDVIRHTVDGALRMQTLIDDLLTYSRLATREAPLEWTDCEAVLDEVIANLGLLIKENKAVITHDPLPTVKADRIQLLQVFQNLISNGIKYRSQRTPKIHVGVDENGDEWRFSVRDNGIGIAPQYSDRIFRIFQRLHTRAEYSGTGIGLAVCKKIIERHGGRIWLESEPEEGSTFYFTLPKP